MTEATASAGMSTRNPGAAGGSRMEWMDLLRGAAILLVITWHSAAILLLFDIAVPAWLVDLNNAFAPYRMPTLMVLSGLLLNRSLSKPGSVYAVGKVSNLVWPWVLWTAVNWLVLQYEAPIWERNVWGKSYLWFLYYLVVLYSLAPLLRRVPAWVLIAGPWIATLAAPDLDSKRFLFLTGFFFLGRLADEHRGVVDRITAHRHLWWAFPIAAAFSVAFAVWGPWRYEGILAVFSVLGILVSVRVARTPAIAARSEALRWVGRNSVVFYVSHFPVIVGVVLITQAAAMPVGVTIAIAFAAAISVGAALTAARRFRVVELLFTLPIRGRSGVVANKIDRASAAISESAPGRWAVPVVGMAALGFVALRLT